MSDKRNVARVTTWIAVVVAVAVTILLPLGCFAVAYQYLVGSLVTEAEMTGRSVTALINANPELWQYEHLRLEELLSRRMPGDHKAVRRVFDRQNRLVAESAPQLKPPLISQRLDLMDSGVAVGTLEVSTSLYSILFRTGLAALFGLSCGVAVFVTLRVLPLRAVAIAEKSLRESRDELAVKVSQLQDALAKVKLLEGIIPICMYCKKIRDDKASWQQLERYISAHSEAEFSHGICPECFDKVTNEIMVEHERKKLR